MATTTATQLEARPDLLRRLQTSHHYQAVVFYLIVVLAHWAEHAVQAIQVYVFNVDRPDANGLIGSFFPSLVESEALHWGYAVFMLGGFIVLRPAFQGRSGAWWTAALAVQVWHWIEHMVLIGQWAVGSNLAGRPVPTSLVQLWLPRVELHLIYNMVVMIPMMIAVSLHWFSFPEESDCNCATRFVSEKESSS